MADKYGVALTHVAFKEDHKKRSILWHIYILPAHIIKLFAYFRGDARAIILSRNAFMQFFISTVIWAPLAWLTFDNYFPETSVALQKKVMSKVQSKPLEEFEQSLERIQTKKFHPIAEPEITKDTNTAPPITAPIATKLKLEDVSSVQTIGGRAHVEGTILFLEDSILLKDEEAFAVGIVAAWPNALAAKYLLIQSTTGGTACPALFRILDLEKRGPAGEPTLSEVFGNCSDLPTVEALEDRLSLYFPAVQAEQREKYNYHQGVLERTQ